MENIISLIASGNNVLALELLIGQGIFPSSDAAREILNNLELKRKQLQEKCPPFDLQNYFKEVEETESEKELCSFSANVRLWEDTVDAYRKTIQLGENLTAFCVDSY